MNGLTELQVGAIYLICFSDAIVLGFVIGFVMRGLNWLFK